MNKVSKASLPIICGLMMVAGGVSAAPSQKDITLKVTANVAEHFSVDVNGSQTTNYAMSFDNGAWSGDKKTVTVKSNIPLQVKLDKKPTLSTADAQPMTLKGVVVKLVNNVNQKVMNLDTVGIAIDNPRGNSAFTLSMFSTDLTPAPGVYSGDVKLEFSVKP